MLNRIPRPVLRRIASSVWWQTHSNLRPCQTRAHSVALPEVSNAIIQPAKASNRGQPGAISRSTTTSTADDWPLRPYDSETDATFRGIARSNQSDWEDPAFWRDLCSREPGLWRWWYLYDIFVHITRSNDPLFILRSPYIFNIFLNASVESDERPNRRLRIVLCKYLSLQYKSHLAKPPDECRTYFKIIWTLLKFQPYMIPSTHLRISHIPPSEEDLSVLILEAALNDQTTELFQDVCFSIPSIKSAYGTIIGRLCEAQLFDVALRWNRDLISKGCGPQDSQSTAPIRRHLLATDQRNELEEFDKTIDHALMQTSAAHVTQALNRHEDFSRGVSDSTFARGLASWFVAPFTVIEGALAFGLAEIGPLALRQLILRISHDKACDMKALHTHLGQLSEAGVGIEDTAFNRLVQKLYKARKAHMLYDIASCDMHSDAFEDLDLQESLYAHYSRTGDNAGAERSMAILLTDTPPRYERVRRLNLELKSSLQKNDKASFESVFEKLSEEGYYIETECLDAIHSRLRLEQFLDSAAPSAMANCLSSNVLRLMDSSRELFIRPAFWSTALRSLLAQGQFTKYEELVWEVTDWYLQSAKRYASRLRRRDPEKETNGQSYDEAKARLGTQLFTGNHIVDLIQYGLYYGKMRDTKDYRFWSQAPRAERRAALNSHAMLWGAQTALKFESAGLPIDRASVLRRARGRIQVLCNGGLDLPNGCMTCMFPGTTMDDYMSAIDDLFSKSEGETS